MPQCWRPKAVLCAFLLRVWENASAHKRSPFYDMGSAEDLELTGLRCRGGFIVTEYIDREAALTAVDETYLDYLAVVKAAVLKIPSADVAPVVHGRWIIGTDNDDFDVKCSKCEWTDIFEVAGIATVERIAKAMHYCQNCGARMDGSVNDETD